MANPDSNLNEMCWRKPPTAEELRQNPELKTEAQLTAALAKIKDVPVASNFTARLLLAIELEEKTAARTSSHWSWRPLFPKFAVAMAVVILAGMSFQRYEIYSHHLAIAKSVAMVAQVHSLPSVDALENLEAIQRIGESTHADGELLAVMQ